MPEILTDRGWFWVVPIGGFIANFIAGGISKSFGLIVKATKELFDTSAAPLTLAGGLIYTFMYCLAIVGIMISQKYGSRTAVNIGSAGCVLSFLCAFFAKTVTMWVISIGCGIGISLAFIYSPIFITLGRCFRKRIGIAIGITVAGSSVGQMVFPTVISYVIDVYGARSVFLFAAILSCHFFVSAALMPRYTVLYQLDKQMKQNNNDSKNRLEMPQEEPIESHFTNLHIAMLSIFISAKVFADIGDVGVAFALPLFGETQLHLSNQEISLAIAVAGVLDLITRLVVGTISDQRWCRRSLLLALAWLVEGCNTLFILWFPSKIVYFISYGIFGLTSGMAVTLMVVVLIDFVGAPNLKHGFGMMTFILGLVISPGQFLMGYINDITGNYIWSMWFLGLNLFIAFLIIILEYPTRRIFKSKQPCSDSQDDVDGDVYNVRRALKGIRYSFMGPLHEDSPSRYATFLLLSTIDANEFLPTAGKVV